MNQYEEEKALLKMKGDALRMKLQAQTRVTKKELYSPFSSLNVLQQTLKEPVARSLLLTLLSKKFFTIQNISYIGLGLSAFYLLNNQQTKKK